MAGLFLHHFGDFNKLVPVNVLQIGGGITRFGQNVGAIEQAGHAGIEGHRIGVAVYGGQLNLVGGKAAVVDLAIQRLKRAGEGQQVFLGAIIFDQHDVRQALGGAGCQLRLQLLFKVYLGEINQIDRHIGVRS